MNILGVSIRVTG